MNWVHRLLPDTIAARLAVLLTLALLAANAVALVILANERDRAGREARLETALERIVDAVPLLENATPVRQRRILRRLSSRSLSSNVSRQPLVGTERIEPRLDPIAQRVGEAIGDTVGSRRELRMATRRFDGARRDGPRWRRGEALLVSIALQAPGPSRWLNATMPLPPERPDRVSPLLLLVGLSLLSVLAVALMFVRRLVRPLRALASAARMAGRGDRTVRVEERGARELREAASAFNDMQGRIAEFDAERMRTLAAVGHDLRTPITSLRIRAEMLDDEQRDAMVRTLDDMRTMADGLVAFARGGQGDERAEPIDLAAFLPTLCEERGVPFARDGADMVQVRARPVALGRAIGNLIDNAARYADEVEVRLSASGTWATIAVEDRGPGIPPEQLNTVVEPFVRGDNSRSSETGGAGLGLSIVRQILVAHGGSLRLLNRDGGGLRAEAILPLA